MNNKIIPVVTYTNADVDKFLFSQKIKESLVFIDGLIIQIIKAI